MQKGSRSSCPEVVPSSCLCNKVILKTFTKLAGKNLCRTLFFDKVAGLKVSQNSQKNTFARVSFVSFFNKVAGLIFSCELCEIFENIFFYRTIPVAASEAPSQKFDRVLYNPQNIVSLGKSLKWDLWKLFHFAEAMNILIKVFC